MGISGGRAAIAGAVLAIAMLAPGVGRATTTDVTVAPSGTLSFSPSTVTIAVGSYVHWTKTAGETHNVRQDAAIFRSGAPTAGSISYTVRFSAGTFHYYCELHGSTSGGMAGYVRVPVAISSSPSGAPFTVRWTVSGAATGTSFDVLYKVGSGSWRTWLSHTTGVDRVFGANAKPVTVRSGTTYYFRARSRKTVNGSVVASSYSPTRTYKP